MQEFWAISPAVLGRLVPKKVMPPTVSGALTDFSPASKGMYQPLTLARVGSSVVVSASKSVTSIRSESFSGVSVSGSVPTAMVSLIMKNLSAIVVERGCSRSPVPASR